MISEEMGSGRHDLLVLGAPLSQAERARPWSGIVEQLVRGTTTYPILIVRSRYAAAGAPWIAANGRVSLGEEVIR